jgi:hypothetical protein
MPVTFANLLTDYKASLNDAASVFTDAHDADFKRHLNAAARALALGKRPRTKVGELTLVADQQTYTTVPADLLLPKSALWGLSGEAPWNLPRGPLPTLTLATGDDDAPMLVLSPAPTACQIAAYGSTYRYWYFAAHTLTDAECTIAERDVNLVILRAQVEAMRELTFRNFIKPVTLRAGSGAAGSQPRNGQPAHLFEALLHEFNGAA